MYRSILVPLDRTSFAEQALPLALSIARRSGAWVELVEVHALYGLGDPTAGWLPFNPKRDTECMRKEQLYLDATAKWATYGSRVRATARVLPGSAVLPATVADSIVEWEREGKADLIVMATHGRGPLSRFPGGSVADELIRRTRVPVLLVRPSEKARGIFSEPDLDNILIPLDGSTLAEQVLEPALDLARLMQARCSLLRVIESRPFPADRTPVESPKNSQGESYLGRVATMVRAMGVQVSTRVVIAPHAVEAILEEAASHASNLIALATHGRGALNRLLLGSVADKLVRAAASPVLVYRPTGKEH
jgi:nucleotide-binding universal stress UspA family protein